MNSKVAETKCKDLLIKPVTSLAIVPVTRKITALGRKMYNVMLGMSQQIGIDRNLHRAPLSEIVNSINYDSNDLELIKKHLQCMVSTRVEWNSPSAGRGPEWTVCTLIAYAILVKERGKVWVVWSYADPMKYELLNPPIFVRLSLAMISQMHTYGGIALYEICCYYRVIGRTSKQDWRWWLPVLTGQPNGERLAKLEYRIFKRDTIRRAIAEINAITDIDVEIVEYKAGKNISELQFLIQRKPYIALPLMANPKPKDTLR